jgi:hypothetical protein
MSSEDLNLLQAVRDWRPPKTLHPIAMRAWHVYVAHGHSLPPSAIQTIQDILDGNGEDLKALAESLEGLFRFVVLLKDHRKDQKSAEQIMNLCRSCMPRFEAFWRRVGEAMTNVAAEKRGTLIAFLDREQTSEKTAPRFGEEAPSNTVPLRNLTVPARPPPWARKRA